MYVSLRSKPRLLTVVVSGLLLLCAVWAFGPSGSSAQDVDEAPEMPSVAGSELCSACHSDVADLQKKSWHGRLIARRSGASECEACHGPSSIHTTDPMSKSTFLNVTRAPASRSAQACLSCHKTKIKNALWRASDHSRGNVACWDCHSAGSSPHASNVRRPDKEVCLDCHKEQRAIFELTSHHPVREGRVACYDCHDPHSRLSTYKMKETCRSCHVRQRGPFVYAHGSISGDLTDGCLDCHRAHGSPNQRLLKYAGRGVCLQCHADRAMHFVPRTCWSSGCHKQVHGSNTSPLLLGR